MKPKPNKGPKPIKGSKPNKGPKPIKGSKPNKGPKPNKLLGAWQKLWDKSIIKWLFLFLL